MVWKSAPSVTWIWLPETTAVASPLPMLELPALLAVTVPVMAMVLRAAVSGSSTSLLTTTGNRVGAASSLMVPVSATACGRSLAPLTVTVRIAVEVTPAVSRMV
jgi:hypothetical protein